MIQEHHQRIISEELTRRGLTFKPLQMEMLDHICCDVETRMDEGMSFDDALRQTMDSVAPEHFKAIQQETMDAIQERISTTRWVSYGGLFFLYTSLCFKVLHLQYGGILLAISFGCFVFSLVLPVVTGIKFNREKPGAIRVLAVVAGIALLLTGHGFRILGLPGSDWIILSAIAITLVAFLVNTRFLHSTATGEGNLLTFLHEKYSPGIEVFLLILLVPVGIYKILCALWQVSVFYGDVVLLIVIFSAGIHLFVLFWRMLEREPSSHSSGVLIAIVISIGLFLAVFAGELIPVRARIIMILLHSIVSAWLVLKFDGKGWGSAAIAISVPAWFFCWAMLRFRILPPEFNTYLFSLPVLLAMSIMVALARRNTALRIYMILSLSAYAFEFLRMTS